MRDPGSAVERDYGELVEQPHLVHVSVGGLYDEGRPAPDHRLMLERDGSRRDREYFTVGASDVGKALVPIVTATNAAGCALDHRQRWL